MRTLLPVMTAAIVLSQPVSAADLTISVTNLSEPTGELRWVLFDSEEAYKSGEQPVMSARNRVDGDSMKITVHNLPSGSYAVRLFHDANNNGELDSNMVGLPTEGYGFSNNAGRFGPPSFEDAAFSLEDDLQIDIRVR